MTQVILAFNAMLISFNGFLVNGALDSVFTSDAHKAIAVVVSSVLIAGISTLLPVVSAKTRQILELRRR